MIPLYIICILLGIIKVFTMVNEIDGKNILVTGGSGSFGKKFAEVVLRDYNPRCIRIYSRGELLQLQIGEPS